ncbi:PqqD family peptide modification chaperone [Paenibacillus elgii]
MQAQKVREQADDQTRLADGVELVYGMNDQPMLYNPNAGNYVRISPLGIKVVEWINQSLTVDEVIERLMKDYRKPSEEVKPAVDKFFEQLRQARMLNTDPIPQEGVRRSVGSLQKRPVLRIPLITSARAFPAPLLNRLELIPRSSLYLACGTVALLAACMVAFYFGYRGFPAISGSLSWLIIIPALMFHLCLHEMVHAVVLQKFGIQIRQAGIGLLYYIFPIAYVDTTDTYRLRNKYDRAMAAWVGPVFDLAGAAISAVISLSSSGWWGDQFQVLLGIQFTIFLFNANPLLPSDGLRMIEALMGEFNLRRRALHYLLCKAAFRPLPNYLVHLPRSKKIQYVLYSTLSIAYFIGLLYMIALYSIKASLSFQ